MPNLISFKKFIPETRRAHYITHDNYSYVFIDKQQQTIFFREV